MADFDFARIVHSGSTLDVGEFRCNGREASRARNGSASGHLVVFPRTPVCITQEGSRPVVTDSNVVMFYNQGCTYAREMLVGEGDCCEFFVVRGDLLVDAISEYDPTRGSWDSMVSVASPTSHATLTSNNFAIRANSSADTRRFPASISVTEGRWIPRILARP